MQKRWYSGGRVTPLTKRTFSGLLGIGERKAMDIQVVYSSIEAGGEQPPIKITMPAQGTTGKTRVGDHIKDHRIQLHWHVVRPDYAAAGSPIDSNGYPERYRMIIIRWNFDDAVATPIFSDILNTSLGGAGGEWEIVVAGLTTDLQKRKKFDIIFDRVYPCGYKKIDASGGNYVAAGFKTENAEIINLYNRNHYFSPTLTTGVGNYYAFILTNHLLAASVGPLITMSAKFWFYDP